MNTLSTTRIAAAAGAAARPSQRPLSTSSDGASAGTASAQSLDWMLDIEDMVQVLRLGKTAIYAAVKARVLPEPYRTFGRRVAWKASEVQACLDALPRVESSEAAAQ